MSGVLVAVLNFAIAFLLLLLLFLCPVAAVRDVKLLLLTLLVAHFLSSSDEENRAKLINAVLLLDWAPNHTHSL